MSGNFVHRARRLRVLFSASHLAGDLVYEKGFFGVVQDNVTSGDYGTLILEGAWLLARTPTTVAMGSSLAAPATAIATTLPLGVRGPVATVAATAGWIPIGRTIATGNATVAKVQLYNPNPVY